MKRREEQLIVLGSGGPRRPTLYSAGTPSLLLVPEVGITQSGGTVSAWNDPVAALTAQQATSGSQPAYSSNGGPSGGPAIVNSSTKYMLIGDAPALNPTGAFALFVVAKRTSGLAFQCLVNPASDTSWNLARFGLGCTTDGTTMVAWAGNYATMRVTWASDTNWHVHELYFNGSVLEYLVDGNSKGTVAATPAASGALCIGAGLATAPSTYGYPWQGPIGGIELVPAPSTSGRSQVRRAWGARSTITVTP